jgi:SAM-dependent methyltransferase
LLHGRSNYARRLATETKFFTDVYDHEIYRSRGASEEMLPVESPRGGFRPSSEGLPDGDAVGAMSAAELQPGDNAYAYGLRLLETLIGRVEPDFAGRLAALRGPGPVRLLSLCSGVAGIERQLIERAAVPAEITLYDINPTLMGRAAATLSPFARVDGVVGDVNEIDPRRFDRPYDVVMCVSGLHHVVELERVLAAASDLLVPGGEFWVVGEQIGRSGNRLWPEVREAANRAFRALPSELRRNAIDGAVDDALREMDYSSTTFEGIRSEEIESLLSRYFEPVEVHRRNCFLWRALEPSYFANYDLTAPSHRKAIHDLVAAEYALWRRGGRPTETWGVYRSRSAPPEVALAGLAPQS